MQIKLNGEPFEFGEQIASGGLPPRDQPVESHSVASLVRQRQLDPRQIAVEVNCQLIPREDYEKVMLTDGDSVEVVTLAGGG